MRVYNKKGASLDFVIRQVRPDEAPKVIALISLQHGKNYPDHTIYDRDFMRDHIEKDIYRIILAEHTDGTAMGVVGFKKENPFPGSLVFSFLVVDPRFRGFGLGKLLLRSLLDHRSGETYTCVWGYCITIDTLSQASHDELGYRPTGLVPNCYFFDANGKFGRNYYMRHDYEGIDVAKANAMVEDMRSRVQELAGSDGIAMADDFAYTDPADGSAAQHEGIRISFANGSRIVMRLSATGTVGATLRVYLEKFASDPAELDLDPREVLKDLGVQAARIARIEEFTGKTAPDVVV